MLQRALAPTRSAAQRLIDRGAVRWRAPGTAWAVPRKTGEDLPEDCEIEVTDDAELRYVSRGGLKLEAALARCAIDVEGRTCLDIGQGTGGFTDVLLQRGAAAWSASRSATASCTRSCAPTARVRCFEGVNARDTGGSAFEAELAEARFDLIVGDVSFISLTHVLPTVLRLMAADGECLLLVKPQFELQPEHIGKGGIVKQAASHAIVETRIWQACKALGFKVNAYFESEVAGGDGNREFFVWAATQGCKDDDVPISFEFFPPNTPVGDEKLKDVVRQLGALEPEFFSVTYGAGGSTRDKTLRTVQAIAAAGHEAAPHLSCVGSTTRWPARDPRHLPRAEHPPHRRAARRHAERHRDGGDFRFAAELVRFIRETQGADWHIEVAAYPEYHPGERYAARDLRHYVDKIKAGADSSITQFFFNADAYFHFVEQTRALGAQAPVVPGIMPFHNFARIAQFAARDGIEIPRWVALKMEGYLDDAASIRAFGLDVVTALCRRLIDGGAPGLHFYTMNQSALVVELCERLGLTPQPEARVTRAATSRRPRSAGRRVRYRARSGAAAAGSRA